MNNNLSLSSHQHFRVKLFTKFENLFVKKSLLRIFEIIICKSDSAQYLNDQSEKIGES